MQTCDVAVVGAGPGGYVAAIRAAQRGAKTVVIEKNELGGVCLNWGCIPTKTLIHTARLFEMMQRAGDFGIETGEVRVNLEALVARKNGVVKNLRTGVRNLLNGHGIEVVKGRATIPEPGLIAAGKNEIKAKATILATGSRPAGLPGLEPDGERVITSTEALELTELPARIAVIGAGPLGAEFACLWNLLGAHVTLIEMLPTIVPQADAELSKRLAVLFKKRGMNVLTGTRVESLDRTKTGIRLEVKGSKTITVDVDLVLVGIGFAPNSEIVTESASLDVEVDDRGWIVVNKRMETTVPGIFAIGDVVGKTMLAHGASAEGIVAAVNATHGHETMDYRVVPACTFTVPEVAQVGLTEQAAKDAGIETKVGRFPFAASGRAMAMSETEGMVKIVGNAGTDEVVGVHVLGAEAGELIASGALAMAMEATVEEMARTIHTHPTLSETMMEAGEDYFGMGIHTPPRKRKRG